MREERIAAVENLGGFLMDFAAGGEDRGMDWGVAQRTACGEGGQEEE